MLVQFLKGGPTGPVANYIHTREDYLRVQRHVSIMFESDSVEYVNFHVPPCLSLQSYP